MGESNLKCRLYYVKGKGGTERERERNLPKRKMIVSRIIKCANYVLSPKGIHAKVVISALKFPNDTKHDQPQ